MDMEGLSKMQQLTEKQRKFIEEYLMSFNVVQSYIRAGYSTNGKPATVNKNAYQLLHSDAIQEVLKEQLELVRDDKEYLVAKLEKFFLENIDDKNASLKDRLKSAELLAKMTGAFENKVNVKTDGDLQFNFNIVDAETETEEDE